MNIKFSHQYPKLHGQTSARLLRIELWDRSELSDKFVEYDTVYDGGHYPLPDDRYMVMVFIGNDLIPFTTVRKWTDEKFKLYQSEIGSIFTIAYKSVESDSSETNQARS